MACFAARLAFDSFLFIQITKPTWRRLSYVLVPGAGEPPRGRCSSAVMRMTGVRDVQRLDMAPLASVSLRDISRYVGYVD